MRRPVFGEGMTSPAQGHKTLHGLARGLARPRDVWQDVRSNGGSIGYVAAILFGASGPPYISVALSGLIAVYYMFEHVPGPTQSPEADE